MRISELKNSMEFVNTYIKAPGLPGLLDQLVAVLRQNAQAGNQQQPITEQKKNLLKAVEAISLERLGLPPFSRTHS